MDFVKKKKMIEKLPSLCFQSLEREKENDVSNCRHDSLIMNNGTGDDGPNNKYDDLIIRRGAMA